LPGPLPRRIVDEAARIPFPRYDLESGGVSLGGNTAGLIELLAAGVVAIVEPPADRARKHTESAALLVAHVATTFGASEHRYSALNIAEEIETALPPSTAAENSDIQ
jgi:hypothetical protein